MNGLKMPQKAKKKISARFARGNNEDPFELHHQTYPVSARQIWTRANETMKYDRKNKSEPLLRDCTPFEGNAQTAGPAALAPRDRATCLTCRKKERRRRKFLSPRRKPRNTQATARPRLRALLFKRGKARIGAAGEIFFSTRANPDAQANTSEIYHANVK